LVEVASRRWFETPAGNRKTPNAAANSYTGLSPFKDSSAKRALKPSHGSCVWLYPDLLVLGDQQTSDRGFRHCPVLGEELKLTQIPKGTWILGFLGLLMDASSEMICDLLLRFLTAGFGVAL